MRKSSANVRFSLRDRIQEIRSFWSYSSRMISSCGGRRAERARIGEKDARRDALAERDAGARVELLKRDLAGKQRRDLHGVERESALEDLAHARRDRAREQERGRRLHHLLLRLLRGRDARWLRRVQIRRAAKEERNDVGRRERRIGRERRVRAEGGPVMRMPMSTVWPASAPAYRH